MLRRRRRRRGEISRVRAAVLCCAVLCRWRRPGETSAGGGFSQQAKQARRLRCETISRQLQAKGSTAAPEQAHSPPSTQIAEACTPRLRAHLTHLTPHVHPRAPPSHTRRVCMSHVFLAVLPHPVASAEPLLRPRRLYAKRPRAPLASDYCTVATHARNPSTPPIPSPACHSTALVIVHIRSTFPLPRTPIRQPVCIWDPSEHPRPPTDLQPASCPLPTLVRVAIETVSGCGTALGVTHR